MGHRGGDLSQVLYRRSWACPLLRGAPNHEHGHCFQGEHGQHEANLDQWWDNHPDRKFLSVFSLALLCQPHQQTEVCYLDNLLPGQLHTDGVIWLPPAQQLPLRLRRHFGALPSKLDMPKHQLHQHYRHYLPTIWQRELLIGHLGQNMRSDHFEHNHTSSAHRQSPGDHATTNALAQHHTPGRGQGRVRWAGV